AHAAQGETARPRGRDLDALGAAGCPLAGGEGRTGRAGNPDNALLLHLGGTTAILVVPAGASLAVPSPAESGVAAVAARLVHPGRARSPGAATGAAGGPAHAPPPRDVRSDRLATD